MLKSLRDKSSSETNCRLLSSLVLLLLATSSGCGQSVNQTPPAQTYTIAGTVTPAANGSGSTLLLSGAANASTTADTAGNFSFSSLANGTYTVTPSRNGFVFSPASQTETINGAAPPLLNFTVTAQSSQTFTISGNLSPTTGSSGAAVKLSGAANATTTADSLGNYSFSGLSNGNYTVTPTKLGISFTPSSQAVTISGNNVSGVNFIATGQTFSVSGIITGGSSAMVMLSGGTSGSTIADGTGNFSFSGLANGNYVVTPSKAGFTFSPSSQSVTVNGANVSGVTFTAMVQSFSISGTISGGSGATVTLTGGATASTTADGSGNFSFAGLANGGYTITPSKAGFTMNPSSKSVTVSGASVTAVNFTATAQTFSLSGSLAPPTGGAGASVVLSGAASATATADASGNYSFTGLANGTYAVTPSHSGYSFNPSSQAVTLNGANVTGVNFTATPVAPTFTISGTISPASVAAGSTVTLSGAAGVATTADASGNYSFTGISSGTYTVTPSSQTATFSPTSQPVTISNTNVTGVNFTATATANVIFFDDFTGNNLNAQWTAMNRHGDYSNSEQQCYLPANVTVSGSYLNIVSQVQTQACGDSTHAPSTWNYTSGMVQWTSFNFEYGTIEFRAKFAGPAGSGAWPAVWMLGINCQASNIQSADNVLGCNWPQNGSREMDLVEVNPSGHDITVNLNTFDTNQTQHSCGVDTTDVTQNFHLYDVVWTSSSVTLKVDGGAGCSLSTAIPTEPMFLIMNNAIGGSGGCPNGGNCPDNSTFPQNMLVDYVKITQP